MTVIGTGISWTNSTWNLVSGCTKVSEGCRFCYAEELMTRLGNFGQTFDQVRLKLERLPHVRRFKPIKQPDGSLAPHLVFVNSMGDFWHQEIPDDVIHRILDVMQGNPWVIFQVLTKRPSRARKFLIDRYGKAGVPENVWFGVSVEDNQVAGRLNVMRRARDGTGGTGTWFVSCEPIVGPTDKLDFSDMQWVITGGESGPRARVMQRQWLLDALAAAQWAGAAIWHKQNGSAAGSHPNSHSAPPYLTAAAQFRWLRDHGFEKLPAEKGGATVDLNTYRQMPRYFHDLAHTLNSYTLT